MGKFDRANGISVAYRGWLAWITEAPRELGHERRLVHELDKCWVEVGQTQPS